MGELFVSDNIAEVAVVWNDWRRGVLQAAVQERLLPAMLAELKARLTSNAIETAMLQVQDRCATLTLWDWPIKCVRAVRGGGFTVVGFVGFGVHGCAIVFESLWLVQPSSSGTSHSWHVSHMPADDAG